MNRKDNKEIILESFMKNMVRDMKKKPVSTDEKLERKFNTYEPAGTNKKAAFLGEFLKKGGNFTPVSNLAKAERVARGLGAMVGATNIRNLADRAIKKFPIIMSEDVDPDTALYIKKMYEEQYAEYLSLMISSETIDASVFGHSKPGVQKAAIDAIEKYHTNIDLSKSSQITKLATNIFKNKEITPDTFIEKLAPVTYEIIRGLKESTTPEDISELLEGAIFINKENADATIKYILDNYTCVQESMRDSRETREKEVVIDKLMTKVETNPADDANKKELLNKFEDVNLEQFIYLLDEAYDFLKDYRQLRGERNTIQSKKDNIIKKIEKIEDNISTYNISAIRENINELHKEIADSLPILKKVETELEKEFEILKQQDSGVEYTIIPPSEENTYNPGGPHYTIYMDPNDAKRSSSSNHFSSTGARYTSNQNLPLVRRINNQKLSMGTRKLITESSSGVNTLVSYINAIKSLITNAYDLRKVLNNFKNILNIRTTRQNDEIIVNLNTDADKNRWRALINYLSLGYITGAVFVKYVSEPNTFNAVINMQLKNQIIKKFAHLDIEQGKLVKNIIANQYKGVGKGKVLKRRIGQFGISSGVKNTLKTAADLNQQGYFYDKDAKLFLTNKNNYSFLKNILDKRLAKITTDSSSIYDNIAGEEKIDISATDLNLVVDKATDLVSESEELQEGLSSLRTRKYALNKSKDYLDMPGSYLKPHVLYPEVVIERRDLKDRRFHQPLVLKINFREKLASGEFGDNEMSAVIGVLGTIIRVPSDEMFYILKSNAEDNPINVSSKPGAIINSLKDLLTSDGAKKAIDNLPMSHEYWSSLKSIKLKSLASTVGGGDPVLNNTHLVFSYNEIDRLKTEMNIDYLSRDKKLTESLIKRYSAYTVAVVSDAHQKVWLYDDVNRTGWNPISINALKGSVGTSDASDLANLMSYAMMKAR